jgi:acetyl esterase/lipase
MLRLFALLSLVLPVMGCAARPASSGFRVESDVRYAGAADGTDPRVGDLYRPDDGATHPAVLLIHGGSWMRGARSDMAKFARDLARAGYVAYTIDYRLAPAHRYPDQLADVRAAFAFLRASARSLAVDPDRIAVMGYSAGAHLALLLGLANEDGGPAPRAVVAGAPPTDLRAYPNSPVVEALIGGSGEELPEAYAEASPITHVSAGDPPVMLCHGTLDLVVDVEQSRRMFEALREAGVHAELLEEPLAGHTTVYLFDGDWFPAVLDFLAAQMR